MLIEKLSLVNTDKEIHVGNDKVCSNSQENSEDKSNSTSIFILFKFIRTCWWL